MEILRKRRAMNLGGSSEVGEGNVKGKQARSDPQIVSDDRVLKPAAERWVMVRNRGKQGDAMKDFPRTDLCSTSRFDVLKDVVVADSSFLGEVDSGKRCEGFDSGKLCEEKNGSVITAAVFPNDSAGLYGLPGDFPGPGVFLDVAVGWDEDELMGGFGFLGLPMG
ncbi:hypothetical protein Dimus_033126, partial [Dionaea muscipula]